MIERWIQQGAKYQSHWAFAPFEVTRVSLDKDLTPTQSIDYFVDAGIEANGLKAAPRADKRTLLRRLSFTLTGLPPTRSELTTFLADDSPAAYEKMVDHYLASPHFGEEMAKHWLDVARYGDTHGLHLDNERAIWAYRDWVIEAMNQNKSFDQFTIEQLAGDLLPNPSAAQLIATGFNRCNVTTSEGGAIDDEFLFRYAVDRTSTTIQTWLGLTGGCAVCHDHKYDPLSMKEFYSLYAFFYSAADPAMDGNVVNTSPFQRITSSDQEQLISILRSIESDSLEELRRLGRIAEAGSTLPLTEIVILDDIEPLGAQTENSDRFGTGLPWDTTNNVAPFSGSRCLTQRFGDKVEMGIKNWLMPTVVPAEAKLVFSSKLNSKEPSDAVFIELKTAKRTKRWAWCNSPELASSVGSGPDRILGTLPSSGDWHTLMVDLVSQGFEPNEVIESIKLGQFGGIASWDELKLTGRFSHDDTKSNDLNHWWKSKKGKDTPFAEGELAAAIKEGPESEAGKKLAIEVADFHRTFIRTDVSPYLITARKHYLDAKANVDIAQRALVGSMIYRDLPQPRQAHVMTRGQYDAPGEAVQPDTPAVFPKLTKASDDQRANRLDLAKWLVDGKNPIVARVTVNRFWQQVFGVGLVETSDDFGSQGTPPTHPELLDWLANDFQQSWDIKRILRTLVMTNAFQRGFPVDSEAFSKDPKNRFLARGPRIRLDAEQIRDNALAVSGLLNRAMGGPGFRGYQPSNIWEPVGYGDSNTRYYIQDHGDVLYRRSIYAFIKRTAPPPFMSNFDAPNRELFCTRRERSNTPLQALQLMNDVQHFEAARVLAERVLRSDMPTDKEKLEYLFEEVLCRKPDSIELALIQENYAKAKDEFASRTVDAKLAIEVGESPVASDLPPTELAALTLVANLVLNLDETVNRN